MTHQTYSQKQVNISAMCHDWRSDFKFGVKNFLTEKRLHHQIHTMNKSSVFIIEFVIQFTYMVNWAGTKVFPATLMQYIYTYARSSFHIAIAALNWIRERGLKTPRLHHPFKLGEIVCCRFTNGQFQRPPTDLNRAPARKTRFKI